METGIHDTPAAPSVENIQAQVDATIQVIDEISNVYVPVDPATGEEQNVENRLEDREDDVAIVVPSESRSPVDIVDMSHIYGPSQRGCVSKYQFQMRESIMTETALLYVTHKIKHAEPSFFLRDYDVVPDEFINYRGAHVMALTGLLIVRYENVALELISGGDTSLHGQIGPDYLYASPEEAFPAVQDKYFSQFADDLEKVGRWNLLTFGRLYGVMQMNAMMFRVPLTGDIYACGYFRTLSFVNHSCRPNAIVTLFPKRCIVQALEQIEAGDEITISYKEIALDIIDGNLARYTHQQANIKCDRGCRCTVCRAMAGEDDNDEEDNEEVEKKKDENNNSNNEEPSARKEELVLGDVAAAKINHNIMAMWCKKTTKQLKKKELTSHVLTMIRASSEEPGAAASEALRERYGHLLLYNTRTASECNSYCADLAYVLGEIYCSFTIHVPRQNSANYKWWANVYLKALMASAINLPHSLSDALLARAYACMMSAGSRGVTEKEKKLWQLDIDEFVSCWVSLRAMHAQVFRNTTYLVLPLYSYPVLFSLTGRYKDDISRLEKEVDVKEVLRQQKEQQERFAAAAAPPPEPPLDPAKYAVTPQSPQVTETIQEELAETISETDAGDLASTEENTIVESPKMVVAIMEEEDTIVIEEMKE